MAQRLEVANALHRRGYSFLINNAPLAKAGAKVVFVPKRVLQDFNLDRPHDANRQIPVLIPSRLEHGLLLLQLPQNLHQGKFIHWLTELVRRGNRAGEDRRQKLLSLILLRSKAVPCQCVGEACCRYNFAGRHLGDLTVTVAGVQAQLADFLRRSGFPRLAFCSVLCLIPYSLKVTCAGA